MRIHDPNELPEPLRSRALAALAEQGGRPGAAAARGKYRNQRVMHGDEVFDSKLELACFLEQRERCAAGELAWFLRQVSFPLPGGVRYRCDFLAVLAVGGVEVIDAKGVLTKEFVIKAKQMLAVYGIEILIWTRKATTPFSQHKARR